MSMYTLARRYEHDFYIVGPNGEALATIVALIDDTYVVTVQGEEVMGGKTFKDEETALQAWIADKTS